MFAQVRPAFAVYAGTAALHLLLLSVMSGPDGPGLREKLLAWDGGLYVDIAEHGYPDSFSYGEDGRLTGNNLAFFPLFPTLIRVVHTVTRLDHGTSGIVAAHLSLIAALVLVHRLVDGLYGRRTATVTLVLLAGAQPMALAFLMSYSEALFLALAAGTLLAAHRHAWLTAGALALLTGLTRPAAAATVAALAVAAGLHLLRERRVTWRPVTAVALGCAGTPLYLWWVGWRLGEPGAWFRVQEAGWGTHWDNGAAFLDFLGETLRRGEGWVAVSTAVLLLGLLCATFLTWHRGTWPPLLVYGTGIVVLTLAQSNYSHSKLRLLVPALLFLLPAARALARAADRTVVVSLTAATLFGCWYGAYMLTAWHYAI
ncbi:membrane protein [Streptomyces eurocidicus]|uniref:Membrane protein n=1 Tax=Streptomyces eurocidicus TaxID=66423 RepID=A0A2N8P158_STREU|nr:membrane protein [Streptomyces eurocidicus]